MFQFAAITSAVGSDPETMTLTALAAWGLTLGIIGGAAQIAGLIVAGIGVRKTRREYDPDYRSWVAKAWARRPGARKNMGVLVADMVSITSETYGSIQIGLRHEPESVAYDLRQLDDRTTELRSELDTLRRVHSEELKQLAAELAQARAELDDQAQQKVQRLATEGLGQEALGLGITAAGVIVALVGTLLAAFG